MAIDCVTISPRLWSLSLSHFQISTSLSNSGGLTISAVGLVYCSDCPLSVAKFFSVLNVCHKMSLMVCGKGLFELVVIYVDMIAS